MNESFHARDELHSHFHLQASAFSDIYGKSGRTGYEKSQNFRVEITKDHRYIV
jgi:hypothetical protein